MSSSSRERILLPYLAKTYRPSSAKEVAARSSALATSPPGRRPAFRTAATINSQASSIDFRFGANPPSSPTAVEYPALCRRSWSAWNVSAP